MTIRIPVKLVLFILYTAAVLGGAFGISYAVFEWQHDDGGPNGSLTLESLDKQIDGLDRRITSVSTRVSGASASNDSSECHAALKQLTFGMFELMVVTIGGSVIPPTIENNLRAQEDAANRTC